MPSSNILLWLLCVLDVICDCILARTVSFAVHCEWCIKFLKFHHDHPPKPTTFPFSLCMCRNYPVYENKTKTSLKSLCRAFLLSFMSVAMGYIKVDHDIVGRNSHGPGLRCRSFDKSWMKGERGGTAAMQANWGLGWVGVAMTIFAAGFGDFFMW